LGAGLLALFALTAVGTITIGRASSVGFTLGQSLYFAVRLVSGPAMFLAIGALTSQLAWSRQSSPPCAWPAPATSARPPWQTETQRSHISRWWAARPCWPRA
jgi:hypothetical protein